jgi:hypothetical protein
VFPWEGILGNRWQEVTSKFYSFLGREWTGKAQCKLQNAIVEPLTPLGLIVGSCPSSLGTEAFEINCSHFLQILHPKMRGIKYSDTTKGLYKDDYEYIHKYPREIIQYQCAIPI